MDRTEFQKLAVRTESVVDQIQVQGDRYDIFICALMALENSGEVLDRFKKHIFYNKEIDLKELRSFIEALETNLDGMYDALVDLEEGDETDEVVNVDLDPRVFHALLGTITEHGEIATAILRGLAEQELDLVNVCEELGDSDWYKALFYEATGIGWENVQAMIIKKLEVRFADKIFTEEEAQTRDLEAERELLNRMIAEAVNEYKASCST